MLGTFFNGALTTSVVYTPKVGAPVTVRASVGLVDPEIDPQRGTLVQVKILSFDVQRSEVPTAPGRGDTILYNGETFSITGPAEPDADGFIWRIMANRRG